MQPIVNQKYFRHTKRGPFRMVAASTLLALIFVSAATSVPCCAADKTKLAEGEYGVTQAPKKETIGKVIDEWTLWRLPNGRLQVEVRPPQWFTPLREKGKMKQTFILTKKMELVGYRVNAVADTEQESISCNLRAHAISCTEGKNHVQRVVDKTPYTLIIAEFYALDLPWFYASIIHRADTPASTTPVYALEEADTDSKVQIVPDTSQEVKYLGKERITVLNKQLDAYKYELPEMHSSVWTDPNSGMVLAFQFTDGDAHSKVMNNDVGRIELVRFKSYNPIFVPELK